MNYYATLGLVLWGYMTLWFVISLLKRRNDVADVAWGLGFVLLAWTSFFLSGVSGSTSGSAGKRSVLVCILVSIWGLRLAWHIQARHRGKAEDYRYLAWRQQWGSWFYARSYAQVYMLQGALLFLISLPVLLINRSDSVSFNLANRIGVLLWIGGFLFESIGDAELARFAKHPAHRGKILQSGLWKYSRHPNYFGEVAQWWGIWLLALGVSGGLPAIIGPLTITFLILKVSGIPMLEKRMAANPEFADYKRRTSLFLPWFPKE